MSKKKLEKIKVFTLGDGDVGKTCFIVQYTENKFQEIHLTTTGIDLKTKEVQLENGTTYQVDFVDTAGQERFRAISVNSIKSADGIILMYDITRQKTYDDISIWMESIKENKGDNFPMILIGNKSDLEEQRAVSKEEGEELALKYKLKFFEISNKTGDNVKEAGLEIIKQIVALKDKEKDEMLKNYEVIQNFQLDKQKAKHKKKHKTCC